MFRPNRAVSPTTNGTGGRLGSSASRAPSVKSKKSKLQNQSDLDLPAYKKNFIDFQSSNGVRTVRGSVGPIDNVRMLLKNGYRHVYMSRKFAVQHGFVPADAEPGSYGYSGLVNIGTWPLTVGYTTTHHPVYLAEETHFDIILGRSFMEKRGIKTDPLDMTHVECLDTGEKLECEVVIIRDGKGEIITVT
ncbi:hypothetical protein Clacol_006860 [Clathrus columnatus]|uniref:Uncharacterized protein n=1 Tax=Clathrus columnatus TaxID=1419009 RepID=A0AAV5AD96_9AGAM|nr:hypothetical protein Clacol_006860 [Clathrus columnatus]